MSIRFAPPTSVVPSRHEVRNPRFALRAFTLVELLVVIGIIAVLMGILLPVISRAREQGNSVACASNIRQIMIAFRMFSNDHAGSLPGGYNDLNNAVEWKRDWLFGKYPTGAYKGGYDMAPESGTIFPYLGENYKVYRCPSRQTGALGSGGGSNGRFDYSFFRCFAGAKITNIKPTSRFNYQGTLLLNMPTPVVCEEDAQYSINNTSGKASMMDGGASDDDQIAHVHRNSKGTGGWYATVDGSVTFFVEVPGGDCDDWITNAPSGAEVNLGGIGATWTFGQWNTR